MLLFLYGSDIWSKKQKLQRIAARFTKEIDPSRMNLLVLEGDQIDEEQVRSIITAAPFMARKRMIVLKNAITGIRRKSLHELLLDIFKELKEHTAVVVSEDADKPKPQKWSNQAAKALWEYLEKQAEREEFKQLWGARLEAAIIKQAKARGLVLQEDAIALLSIFSGGDLEYAEKEMEKITAYCGGRIVSGEDIKELCAAQSEASIFEFLDALGNRNQKALMRAMQEQLRETDSFNLITRATGQVRALLAMALKGQAGARALQLHPFQARKISAQARNWEIAALKRFLLQLAALDYSIKRGLDADPATQLAALFVRLV